MTTRRKFVKKSAHIAVVGSFLGYRGYSYSQKSERKSGINNSLGKVAKSMHVGGDYHMVYCGDNMKCRDWSSKENFDFHARFGVKDFTCHMGGDNYVWDLDHMLKAKENCVKADVNWEAIRMGNEIIRYNPGDDRIRRIEEIKDNIRKASKVGVKVITVHWRIHPTMRNEVRIGRGGSKCQSFKLEKNWRELPVVETGRISSEEYWKRLSWVLSELIPVCEEYDVRLATHPYNPPGLPKGYRGVDNWNGEPISVFESLKKFEALYESKYNGFQLCLGTLMEGLEDPGKELTPIVRYFAEKDKIFQIHMRNIFGGLRDFRESYIDEGEANFIEIIRILKDNDYKYSICPDHVPKHLEDPNGFYAFGHAFGYIQGMIDSVYY